MSEKKKSIRAGQYQMVPIDKLVPYERNARIHSEAQIEQLRASMREFGFVSPIVVDENYNILAGHGRLLAARAEGMEYVPCVFTEGLTDAQRRAYILADNRLAEMATWDENLVALEMEELTALDFDVAIIGFDSDEDPGDAASPGSDDEERAKPHDIDVTKTYHCPNCGFDFKAK